MKSWRTFSYFARAYPLKGLVMVLALTVAGVLEGLGIITLLPLIGILTDQDSSDGGLISEFANSIFTVAGVKPTVVSALAFVVGFMLLKAAVNMLAIMQIAYTSSHVAADLRVNYISSLLNARWRHYVGLKSGAVANAIGTEAERAGVSFKQGCQVLAYLMQIMIYALIAFLVSWKLTVAAVVCGILLVGILGFLTREARRAGNRMTRVYEDVLSFITDSFYGAKPLKAMNKGSTLMALLEKHIRALQSSQRRLDIVDQSLWVLSEPILVVFVAAGLYGALTYTSLPLAELLFMAVLFLRMVMRVSTAQRSYQGMVASESALWSIKGKTDRALEEKEDFTGTAKPSLEKAIELKNISFAYDDKINVINGLSLKLPVNKLHVIFGPSGTGKTTLVDLIIGLHSPTAGDILIDGTPLAKVDLKAWRSMIGYVPQDVLLFHDTIFNNLTLNSDGISRNEAEQALIMAGAWDFVSTMEDGLDTMVGERGSRLSGGQRQRIAIARAIINKPSLLILDEATSALDPETEKQVLETVKELSKVMTVLAISHNTATKDIADNIYDLTAK